MSLRSALARMVALSLAVFALAGCGGGASSPAGSGGTARPQTTVFGLATLDGEPLEGATVSVVSDLGQAFPLAEESTTGHGGAFMARPLPFVPARPFTVVVTATNGEVFATEVEGTTDSRPPFVHVNALTTLCRAYHARHPELSVSQVRDRVHRRVGIRPRFDLGDQVASPVYSLFSSRVFMDRARLHPGGAHAYMDSVAQGFDAPARAGRASLGDGVDPGNWIVPYVEPQNFLANIAPEWESGVGRMVAPATTAAEDVAEEFSLATAVGDGLIDSAIGLIVDHIPGIGIITEFNQVENHLAEIQTQLDQITQALGLLATTLNQQFTQTEYTNLSSSLEQQAQDIRGVYAQLQQIQQDAYGVPPAHAPNTTALSTDVQSLFANTDWTNTEIQADAGTIHTVQALGTPGNQPLLTYARQLTYTNHFLGSANTGLLQSQMSYYQGLQVQALNALAALNAPSPYTVVGQNTPAGLRLQAARWVSQISANLAQELMQEPFPPYTQNYFADLPNAMLYQNASVSTKGVGAECTYALALTDGGMSWQAAGNPSVQNTFNLVNQITGNSSQSISGWLNANLGTNLQPGAVTYYSSKSPGAVFTSTSKGFVTITAVPAKTAGQFNFTVGWIDDHAKSGTIGTYTGTWANFASDIDSGGWAIYFGSATGGYAAAVKGPILVMRASDSASTAAFGSEVVLGQYTGLSVSTTSPGGSGASPFVPDPYSKGSSGTMSLYATPISSQGTATPVDLSGDVCWTSSDPINAPISNVPSTPGTVSDAQFPPLAMSPGTIHWLPGSFGQKVTFTAQRQRPQDPPGTLVQASVTLASPVTASAPDAQAVSTWPSRYNVLASNWSDFAARGLQLYATRYYGSGDCQDVGSAVTWTLGPNSDGFTVSPQGWLSTTLPTQPAAGTKLVITVTDSAVPAQTSEGNVRQSDTVTITFN